MDKETNDKPFFTSLEARVIASLMEKQMTTPNSYPLTLNSLILACNQKTNREPVMNLTEGQVGHTVNGLKDRSLVNVDYGSRSDHISHNVMSQLKLKKSTQAILTVLMVRKPLTVNDIKVRTQRMHEFCDHQEILDHLDDMINLDKPLVTCLPKGQGSREDRYTHLLCGAPQAHHSDTKNIVVDSSNLGVKMNVTQQVKLEERIKTLEQKVEQLMQLID